MRLKQGFKNLFGLVIGNYCCEIPSCDKFFELFFQQLPILGYEATDTGIVTSVIKCGRGCGIDKELAVSLND
jgi:hypothetical protein